MIEATTTITPAGSDRRLAILDGLSRLAATLVMATLLFSVMLVSWPPALSRTTWPALSSPAESVPIGIEKSWTESQFSPDFDSMYGSRSRG